MKNNMHPQNGVFMDENGERYCLVTLLKNMGTGTSGNSIELRKGETHIEWKYINEEEWKQLVSLENLKGEPGVVQDATTSQKGIVNQATGVEIISKANIDGSITGTGADTQLEAMRILVNDMRGKINNLLTNLKTAGIMEN